MLVPTNAAEAVANGAQLLDEKDPRWYNRINLGTLNIESPTRCVCGQLSLGRFGHYARTVMGSNNPDDLGLYGFTNCHGHTDAPPGCRDFATYSELTAEWKLAIQARRDADRLKTEEKEAVLA